MRSLLILITGLEINNLLFLSEFHLSSNVLFQVTLKYNGPGNPGPRDNIYVFMIFRQSGHVTVPASWQTKMQRRINFTDFVTDWHLTGILLSFHYQL